MESDGSDPVSLRTTNQRQGARLSDARDCMVPPERATVIGAGSGEAILEAVRACPAGASPQPGWSASAEFGLDLREAVAQQGELGLDVIV